MSSKDEVEEKKKTHQQMQEVVYNSLDVIEERINTKGRSIREGGFLGCLAVVGPECLYGCVTNTGNRIVVGVRGGVGEEIAVREVFHGLRRAVVRCFLNGVVRSSACVGGARFDGEVDRLVEWFDAGYVGVQ